MDLPVKIRKVEYIGGTLQPERVSLPSLPYIILAGRSNVGKSSLLNMLLKRKIAYVGKAPGKTQLLNFFVINDALVLVDLPGYGYARVSKELQRKWQKALLNFLKSPNIKGALSLIDMRHPPMRNDRELMELLLSIPINFRIVLTKADKLSKNKQQRMLSIIAKELKIPPDELIITSAVKKIGIDNVWEAILNYLESDVKEKLVF